MLQLAGSALTGMQQNVRTEVILLPLQVTTLCTEIIGGLSFHHLPAIASRFIQVCAAPPGVSLDQCARDS